MRLRDSAGVALRGSVENPGAYGGSAGVELQLPRGVPDPDQDDGLVQAGRRGAAAHTSRVRLEGRRTGLSQPRRRLAHGTLQVPLHAGGRVLGSRAQAQIPELQRHGHHAGF